MKTCSGCTHYHDFNDKLMCDLGMFEVHSFGNPIVIADKPDCVLFDEIELDIVTERKKAGRPRKDA